MDLLRGKKTTIRYLLSELASLSTGYSFRGGFSESEDGPFVIQLRDLERAGDIAFSGLLRGSSNGATSEHFVLPGDLVFRPRGARFMAALVPAEAGGALLAAPLVRIRIGSALLLPEYLVWYINGKLGNAYLSCRTEGSTVQKIDMQDLKEMPILVPSLEYQHAASRLLALQKREADLAEQLLKQRRMLIDQVIEQSLAK